MTHQFFFLSLLFFLPTQLGRHFWPDFATVSGLRVDYLSPTLFVTDVLLLLTFAAFLFEKRNMFKFKLNVVGLLKRFWPFLLFFLLAFFALLLSKNPGAGILGLLRIIEFSLFGLFVARTINVKKICPAMLSVLSLGVLFEGALAIAQFYNQASLGGVFWFLGERTFTGVTPGIANASIDGQLLLRPYGTFPHPNVLAGYLAIAMAIVISNFKFHSRSAHISNFTREARPKILGVAALVVGTIALFFTMSRVAAALWMVLLVTLLLTSLWQIFRKNFVLLALFLLVVVSSGFLFVRTPIASRFFLQSTDESVVRRGELNNAAIKMVGDNPLSGVGVNNFIANLPFYQETKSTILYLQPVHNIYLLVLAETGIIGLIVFIWFLVKTYQRIMLAPALERSAKKYELRSKSFMSLAHNSKFILLSSILILGLFDHYLLTLQQGQLLFSLILGLCWNQRVNGRNVHD